MLQIGSLARNEPHVYNVRNDGIERKTEGRTE